jgi:hypothetical protein
MMMRRAIQVLVLSMAAAGLAAYCLQGAAAQQANPPAATPQPSGAATAGGQPAASHVPRTEVHTWGQTQGGGRPRSTGTTGWLHAHHQQHDRNKPAIANHQHHAGENHSGWLHAHQGRKAKGHETGWLNAHHWRKGPRKSWKFGPKAHGSGQGSATSPAHYHPRRYGH